MEQLNIIKIGGNVIDREEDLDRFLKSFAALEGKKILVHGGGKLATEMAAQLGLPQQMVEGRRVTDAATLKVVTMVYAGYINKQVVTKLQRNGCNAIGLSGADGNLVRAHKRTGAEYDFGFAGDVDEVAGDLAKTLLDMGHSLVIAPITHDGKGQLLNTNADTIAQELGRALSARYHVQLIYCFEKEGVLRDVNNAQSLIPVIRPGDLAGLREQQVIHSGMLPKLHNAFTALEAGVKKVIIGKWDRLVALTQQETGTAIIH